ncbi:MAG: outer membrane beta-barrel protein [Acidobacteriota bacterium]
MSHFIHRSLLVVAALAIALPLAAQGRHASDDNSFRVRAGLFTPDGESAYWQDNESFFASSADDFEDVVIGADFRWHLGPRSALQLSVDVYSGEEDLAYADFVDFFGDPIVHTTTLDVASVTAAYVVDLTSRSSPVIPYVGVGGGVYDWTLEESGDFIDFNLVEPEVFTDTFQASDTTLGWYFLAGVEVPISAQMSVFAEGRWQDVDEELGDDFDGLGSLDLSGRNLYGGFAWSF